MPSVRRAGPVLAVFTVLGVAACDSSTGLGDDTPLELQFSVDEAEKSVGEEFDFEFDAQGNVLSRITVTMGDGEQRTRELHGAQNAQGEIPYAYEESGEYEVTAELFTLDQGVAGEDLDVTVTGNDG